MDSMPLFTPVAIGQRTSLNRLVINAMECNDADERGNPSPKTYDRYEKLFAGGAGVIFLEAISVGYESRSRLHQLSVMPHNQPSLDAFVSAVKQVNSKPLFIWQLTHSGELSQPDFSRRVCVKPLPGYEGEVLTEEEVDQIIDRFVQGAKIAYDSGADGVDIKLCHGYLGTQILRPYNDRLWKYGGPWENRRRFAFDLYEKVRQAVPDPRFIIGSKVTLWEGIPGGQGTAGPETAVMDLTEPLDLVQGLEERGAHFIMVSAGNPNLTIALAHPDRRIPEYAYLHHTFQQETRRVLKPETVVIGSAYSIFRDGVNALPALDPARKTLLYWANRNIRERITDLVAIGRQSLADPMIPVKLQEGKTGEIAWCTLCDVCMELLVRQKNAGCVVHAREYADILAAARKTEGKIQFKPV